MEDRRNRNKLILILAILGMFAGCAHLQQQQYAGTFNIHFGVWKEWGPSKKIGPAAAGHEGDFWNVVGVPWIDDHTESGLSWANGDASPILVRMVNLGGGWTNNDRMGVKDPMLNTYNYPKNNQGGDAEVSLGNIPAGVYDLYVYGHGAAPDYNGDYEVTVGGRGYGRKATSHEMDAVANTHWVEGSQYVKFPKIEVKAGDTVEIVIHPGMGQPRDAMICGLQLIAR